MRKSTPNLLTLLVTLGLSLATAGCGEDGPPLGTVTGTVTKDGKPVPGVGVTFYPKEGRPSSSSTNDQGVYELLYSPTRNGAIVGEHTVRFVLPSNKSQPQPANTTEEVEITGGPQKETSWPDPQVVKDGENTIDFNLDQLQG